MIMHATLYMKAINILLMGEYKIKFVCYHLDYHEYRSIV